MPPALSSWTHEQDDEASVKHLSQLTEISMSAESPLRLWTKRITPHKSAPSFMTGPELRLNPGRQVSIWNCDGNILLKCATSPSPLRYTENRDTENARDHSRAFSILTGIHLSQSEGSGWLTLLTGRI
jgi:hypothetical protein